ncbi:hypothetical protein [Limimaricola cinnabarinus]|jgi:Flp pilus assembly pilin Flp|uniref:Pilus assembly protein n=1 Tax=Limimaricola cinnabarinus TaxID=1125964 RepID=A0A2G1ML48_9RHOB|nr:hypothetical protein [Limimaricola cinnabarinus]PHP29478.1 hypothetical protein CJ301_03170 [Limimaricola cinnabarinus]
MLNFFKSFANDEAGAVTVDWVVLTAAIVGIGVAILATVSDGVDTLADNIESGLETVDTDYGPEGEDNNG